MRACLAGVALVAGACAATPSGDLVSVSDGRPAMGTLLEITLVGRAGEVSRADLEPLFAEVDRLERILTRWDAASALSTLNAAAGSGSRAVPPELARILADCVTWSRETGGSFDVTVGALVALWREAGRRGRLPTAAEADAARAAVGAAKLGLGADGRVALPAGMALDLDGVAKGWALDRVAGRLRGSGVAGALLDFGGSSVVAIGRPADAPHWRTLLRGAGDAPAGVLTLRDRALSVSGSLGEWSEIEGRRYGHVIDPRNGEPLSRAFQAAVLAPGAGEAEAWSKALLVLGAEEGIARLAERPGLEGMLIDEAGRRLATPGFAAAFDPVDRP